MNATKPTNLLYLFTLLLCIIWQQSNAQCHIDDWTALKALYESTNGDNWKDNTGWELIKESNPPANCNLGNLFGISLDADGRRISAIKLGDNKLTGSIISELEKSSNLNSLYLNNNQLSSSIPPEIGNLGDLTELFLYENELTGSIPKELKNLSNLTSLFLTKNNFTGDIPSELGELINLTSLRLNGNNLTGNIPVELTQLTNLTALQLGSNKLEGNIPPELENLIKLEELSLAENQLSGGIPPELGRLESLKTLYLRDNPLGGSIPQELDNLSNLTVLFLSNNELTGSIPPELVNLSNLKSLLLYDNKLTGNIPIELAQLDSLAGLKLNSNELSGSIPSELVQLSNLTELALSNNDLSGCFNSNLMSLCTQLTDNTVNAGNFLISDGNNFDASWEEFCATGAGTCNIPTQCHIDDWTALKALFESTNGDNWKDNTGWEVIKEGTPPANCNLGKLFGISLNADDRVNKIDLNNNQLTGNIPSGLDKLSKLTSLVLYSNQLTGSIPIDLGNLNNLSELNLFNNKLTGNIPPELEKLSELTQLWLSTNQLSGTIPPEMGKLSNLTFLDLSINQLSGSIPSELGNLSKLRIFYITNNQLTGNIPAELGNLNELEHLSLLINNLNGNIPPKLGDLTNLKTLRLRDNNLDGGIPHELGNLNKLTHLYINNNKLSGCFDNNLVGLCTQLKDSISLKNNNFDATWEDFCATNAGNCGCINNAGTANALQTICFGDVLHADTINATVDDNAVISYVLHTDSTTVNDLNIIAWESTGVFKNDETYPLNQPLYISAIVGGPDANSRPNLNDPCTDFVLPGTPVVFLDKDASLDNCLPGEVIKQFGNDELGEKAKEEFLTENAELVMDSCNCNRNLFLFKTKDAITYQRLITNTKELASGKPAEVDDPNVPTASSVWLQTDSVYKVNHVNSNVFDVNNHEVIVYNLDTGLDKDGWDAADKFLYNPHAPLNTLCYPDTLLSQGYGYTGISISRNFKDNQFHGTFGVRAMADSLINNKGNFKIVPLKVFNTDGEGNLFKLICAIFHAVDEGAHVINVSAGYVGKESIILEEAVKYAESKGVFIVCAAGNDQLNIDSIPQYPAYYAKTYDNVISVASININNQLSEKSNYGKESVTLSAYGEKIVGKGLNDSDIALNGTSVATFYVSRELSIEIARDANRTYKEIWADFVNGRLIVNKSTKDLTKTGQQLNIELIEIKNKCLTPVSIKINNTTANSVNIISDQFKFTDVYVYQYRKKGDSNWNLPLTSNTNIFDITALEACTNYEIRLKSICFEDESQYSAPISFVTSCNNVCLAKNEMLKFKIDSFDVKFILNNDDSDLFEVEIRNEDDSYQNTYHGKDTIAVELPKVGNYFWKWRYQCADSTWSAYSEEKDFSLCLIDCSKTNK